MNFSLNNHSRQYKMSQQDAMWTLCTFGSGCVYAHRHWKLAEQESSSINSFVHRTIAIAECIPIFGGIFSGIERGLVSLYQKINDGSAKKIVDSKREISVEKTKGLRNVILAQPIDSKKGNESEGAADSEPEVDHSPVDHSKETKQKGFREDNTGNTRLHVALKEKYLDLVWKYLEEGDAVNSFNGYGESILLYAITYLDDNSQESLDIIEKLLAQGARTRFDLTCNTTFGNIFHIAVDYGKEHFIQKFLELPNSSDYIKEESDHKKTPLDIAFRNHRKIENEKQCRIINLLLDHGANINKLVVGARASDKDENDQVCLEFSWNQGRDDLVDLCLKRQADIEALCPGGSNLLMRVCSECYYNPQPDEKIKKIIEKLVKAGANVNHQSKQKYTALHFAAQNGLTTSIEYLISRGANKSIKDADGLTPLDHYNHGIRWKIFFAEESGEEYTPSPEEERIRALLS